MRESNVPRDALPYTKDFDEMKGEYERALSVSISEPDFWQVLRGIGKFGRLSTGKRKRAPASPTITHEQQLELLRLFPDGIGSRDSLPYTQEFDDLHRQYMQLTKTKLTKHHFWRVTSRVGKLSRKPKPVFEVAPQGDLPIEIVQFLQRTNPWWEGKPDAVTESFRRWGFDDVMERMKSEIAPVVIMRGPRQIGKTTIQRQVIEHLLLIEHVGPERILRVQFDEVPGLGALVHPVESLIRWFETNVLKDTINAYARRGQPVYLFFDELQNLKQWPEQLKALVDATTVRAFMTGSSALRMAKGQESLAGRVSLLELPPLKLGEIVGIRKMPGNLLRYAAKKPFEAWRSREFWLGLIKFGHSHRKLRTEAFNAFSDVGGYPRAHLHALQDHSVLRQQLIKDVVTKTIEQDAQRKRDTGIDPQLVTHVFRLICRYSGQIVRPVRLAEELQSVLGATPTLSRMNDTIRFLTDSLLVRSIRPLEMLQRKQDSHPKLCVCDPFVRNGILQETIPIAPGKLEGLPEAISGVAGHLVEAVIGCFLSSLPGAEVAYLPKRNDDPEIDLVITVGTQHIPIEVKYQRKIRRSDRKGIEWFCEQKHFGAPFGLMITQDNAGALGESTIAIPASTFLLLR